MDKKILSVAIAGAIAGSVAFAANADTTVYGQINMSVGATQLDANGGTQLTQAQQYDNFQVRSMASRLGFKGSEDLGGGLKANFQLEYEVHPDAGTNGGYAASSNETLKRRNMWVGISGDSWGEMRFGRHDTPTKMAQGGFDQFNDTDADIKGPAIYDSNAPSISEAENRVDNVIAYISPNFSGFTVAGAMLAGEANKAQEAAGTSDGTGLADAYSLAGMYSNGPLFASLAYDSYCACDNTDNNEIESLWRGVATYKIGDAQIGGLYESSSYEDGLGATHGDHTAWGLSGNYALGNIVLKAQYMDGKYDGISGGSDDETTQWTLGADYNFSKRTTAYAMYTSATKDNFNTTDTDYTFAGVGLLHKF